jgi:hypothetical protein
VSRSIDVLVEAWDEELYDESADLAQVLRGALRDDYAGAADAEMEDALDAVLDAMSPAEAFSFRNALRQIERGASRALANPMVSQALKTALPLGAGALGTVIGGPVGTALGSKLGAVAANALPGAAAGRPTTPSATGGGSPVAGGSAAAAQGMVLTQQPDVLQALLSLAMGKHGQKTVNGVPVADIMNMLSSVFGQAAADADVLMYLDAADDGEAEDVPADALPDDRSLYAALLDADNYELSEGLS